MSERSGGFELGGYREFASSAALAPYVEASWVYRTPRDATDGVVHRVVPDPALSIVYWCRRAADGHVTDPRITIIGAVATPRLCAFRPGEEMAAVKLKLEWVRPLLGLDAAAHVDGVDDLSDIAPALARSLLEPMSELRTAEAAMRSLASTIERAIDRVPRSAGRRLDVAAAHALELVRRDDGRVTVERVAESAGSSLRHLRRAVARETGFSLKAYARSVRFVRTVTSADGEQAPRWARLALERGYCDQSHLVRDFQAFAGLSPDRLFRERRAEAEMSNRA